MRFESERKKPESRRYKMKRDFPDAALDKRLILLSGEPL